MDQGNESQASSKLEKFLLKSKRLVLNDGSPRFFCKTTCGAHHLTIDINAVPSRALLECSWKTIAPVGSTKQGDTDLQHSLSVEFSDYLPIITTNHCHPGKAKKHGKARWNLHKADWTKFRQRRDDGLKRIYEDNTNAVSLERTNRELTRALNQVSADSITRSKLKGKPW